MYFFFRLRLLLTQLYENNEMRLLSFTLLALILGTSTDLNLSPNLLIAPYGVQLHTQ